MMSSEICIVRAPGVLVIYCSVRSTTGCICIFISFHVTFWNKQYLMTSTQISLWPRKSRSTSVSILCVCVEVKYQPTRLSFAQVYFSTMSNTNLCVSGSKPLAQGTPASLFKKALHACWKSEGTFNSQSSCACDSSVIVWHRRPRLFHCRTETQRHKLWVSSPHEGTI